MVVFVGRHHPYDLASTRVRNYSNLTESHSKKQHHSSLVLRQPSKEVVHITHCSNERRLE